MRFRRRHRPEPYGDTSRKRVAFRTLIEHLAQTADTWPVLVGCIKSGGTVPNHTTPQIE